MKKWLSLFLVLTCSLVFASGHPVLSEAEKAYDAKQYGRAVELYEQLIKEGYTSFQLYYNLGNACYKKGELGKAIHAYELARKLEPDEEDIKINLGIANAKTIDKIDTKENFFITAVKTNLLSSLSTKAWAWLSILSLFLASLSFFVFYSITQPGLRRLFFSFSLLFVFGFIISYALGSAAVRSKSVNKFAIVLSKEVKVMSEPTPAASIRFRLHEGTKVRVIENNGDWLLIKLENGNEGWLMAPDLGII